MHLASADKAAAGPASDALARLYERMPRDATFGNGRAARKVFEEMVDRQAFRLGSMDSPAESDLSLLLPEDVGGDSAADADAVPDSAQLLAELGAMIGLSAVKREVTALVNVLTTARHRRAAGLPTPNVGRHLVFSGPPGTGKTTVARVYADLLRSLDVLPKGQLVEVARADLVNARTARQLMDAMMTRQAGRLGAMAVPGLEDLRTLLPEDLPGQDLATA